MLISVQAEKTACGPQSTAARTRGRAQTRSGAGSPVPNEVGCYCSTDRWRRRGSTADGPDRDTRSRRSPPALGFPKALATGITIGIRRPTHARDHLVLPKVGAPRGWPIKAR